MAINLRELRETKQRFGELKVPISRSSNVTLKEVADRAGVSVAAVSKVLHGRGESVRVGKEKAKIIKEVASEMQYVPNGLARSLRTNRTFNIGLVFENFGAITEGRFYVELLDGAAQELFKNKFRLTILPEVDRERPLDMVGDGLLDGVIWCKFPDSADVVEILHRSPVAFVALHARPTEDRAKMAYVSCDNFGGAKLAVQHLVEKGHRQILFVHESGEQFVPDAQARFSGFVEGCFENEIPCTEDNVVVWERDMNQFESWVRTKPEHTAMLVWNERSAAVILDRAKQLGISIPDQLSVIGFDSTPFSETTTPKLTCVHQPIREMAVAAVQLLINQINSQVPAIDKEFETRLDIRETTALAPASPVWTKLFEDEKKL